MPNLVSVRCRLARSLVTLTTVAVATLTTAGTSLAAAHSYSGGRHPLVVLGQDVGDAPVGLLT